MKEGRIDFIDGVGERDGAIAGGRFRVFLFTFEDHYHCGLCPILWGGGRGENVIIMFKELKTNRSMGSTSIAQPAHCPGRGPCGAAFYEELRRALFQ